TARRPFVTVARPAARHTLSLPAALPICFATGYEERRRHSTLGGSGNPCARSAVRKCIFATLGRVSAPNFVTNCFAVASTAADARSEEHTSELQSRGQLVCRLRPDTISST